LQTQEKSENFFIEEKTEWSLSNAALVCLIQEVLGRGGSFKFIAKGFSMAPFIRDQDEITVSPLKGLGVGIGRVAVRINPKSGGIVVHRVIWRSKAMYIIRADNGYAADGVFPRTHIIGQVTEIGRAGKNITFGLGFERYIVAFLSLTGILCCLLQGLRILRKVFDSLAGTTRT